MSIADLLATYEAYDEVEEAHLARFWSFIGRYAAPFDRAIAEGHLTGSAFILDASMEHVVLLHHLKVGKWLQPGGHAEPDEVDSEAIAFREAREETGLNDLWLHPTAKRPFDLDIHLFPARGNDLGHWHLDVRYLLLTTDGAALRLAPEESADIRWFNWTEVDALPLDSGTERALRKARSLASAVRPAAAP